jgi:hypothetical protein
MNHPYTQFEGTAVWRAVDAAIAALERNSDLNLCTVREYVIGYLVEQLAAAKMLGSKSLSVE